jgi:hypothetical protein
MPDISIPHDLFRRLSDQAKALNRSVDEYILPTLQKLAEYGQPLSGSKPLSDEEWEREMEAWDRDAEELARRLPPGFQVDDSRESMYFDGDETGS